MGDQNGNQLSKISMPLPVSMHKIASLPSLAAGLISPAAVAKAPISKIVTSTASSTIGQQIALLNNSGANTNILIKTTKTNSSGQPTYVAISIPTLNNNITTSGQKVMPLAIHQLKINKQQQQTEDGREKDSTGVKHESKSDKLLMSKC